MARLRRRPSVWALAFAPAIVLIALLVWGLIALESASRPTPNASATPLDEAATPTPEQPSGAASATPLPTAPAAAPLEITIIEGTGEIVCSGDITLYFRWSAPNATIVTFAVAGHEHLFELPPTGNSMDDFPYPVEFPCPAQTETYRFLAISGDERAEVLVTVLGDP